jgi:excisionase family DNA binding protein
MSESDLLTPAEAADYLRISERSLRRLVADGSLPATRIGSKRRHRRSDLDAFITSVTRRRAPVQVVRAVPIDFGRTDWWQ